MPSHRKSPAHRSKQRKNQHAAGIDCSRFQQQQSVNQNTFSGPDHNVQTLTLIFDLNARHRVIVQYFDVSILLEGRFLLKRMKELPEIQLLVIIFGIVN